MAFLASYLRFIRHRTIAALILRRRKLLLCVLRDLALYLPVVIGVLLQFHEGYRFVLHQEVEVDALQGLMEKVGIPVPPYAARATVVGLPYRDDAVRQICNRGCLYPILHSQTSCQGQGFLTPMTSISAQSSVSPSS